MKSRKDGYGYNERLFSSGLRGFFHLSRFKWFETELQALRCPTRSVLELGCFDGKLLNFLPQKPSRYVGFDANWEGGLDLAISKWGAQRNYEFHLCRTPEEMTLKSDEKFDVAVVMETLEHVPPHLVEGYLQKIAEHLSGYLFVTVPNEKGLPFLFKWAGKRILSKDNDRYSLAEVINAARGRMHLIERREHKGFDYSSLIGQIGKYFHLVEVSGHPFGVMPKSLCFGIGVVAKSKREF